jgi:lipid-binding SYLF domain-containing protein
MRSLAALIALAAAASAGCSSFRTTTSRTEILHDRTTAAIAALKERDPGIEEFFENAFAYAIFPSVGKGAVGIGGAHGEGEVYQGGKHVGWAELSQGTIGFQLGGQVYTEVIFFQDEHAFDLFRMNRLEFSGNASAVAVKAGASATADYDRGVAVFTLPRGGLMFEASIGGQKLEFIPK